MHSGSRAVCVYCAACPLYQQTATGEVKLQVAALTYCSYNERMGYEWDEEKRRLNREKHGVDFSTIEASIGRIRQSVRTIGIRSSATSHWDVLALASM